jgi:hypothetical protein
MTIHPDASRDECLLHIGELEREIERLRESYDFQLDMNSYLVAAVAKVVDEVVELRALLDFQEPQKRSYERSKTSGTRGRQGR